MKQFSSPIEENHAICTYVGAFIFSLFGELLATVKQPLAFILSKYQGGIWPATWPSQAHLKWPGISQKVKPDALARGGGRQPSLPGAPRRLRFPSLLQQGAVCINSLQIREKIDPLLFSSLLLLVVTTLTVLDINGSYIVDRGQCLALKRSFCMLIH